jgi:hypothetical protein
VRLSLQLRAHPLSTTERGVVLLASGQLLKIQGVVLYPIEAVSEIARLREMAASKMGGVSTGIGFLGAMSRGYLAEILARHGKTKADMINGHIQYDDVKVYVHDGGEFFVADTETGEMNIRWQGVVAFTSSQQ